MTDTIVRRHVLRLALAVAGLAAAAPPATAAEMQWRRRYRRRRFVRRRWRRMSPAERALIDRHNVPSSAGPGQVVPN
jgi:hypothetical protein